MVYVLTKSYNDYDQHGRYFVAAFCRPPSIASIRELLGISFDDAAHIAHDGGGRRASEYEWYNLDTVRLGHDYHNEGTL